MGDEGSSFKALQKVEKTLDQNFTLLLETIYRLDVRHPKMEGQWEMGKTAAS